MSGTAPEWTSTCAICGATFHPSMLLGHLRGAHDMDVEIAEWPDGAPVIVDLTLEPDDFARDPQEGA